MRKKITQILAAGFLGIPAILPLTASNVSYHVDVDVSGLPSNPNVGYALDFQLTDGDGLNNTTATVSNFTFGGGGAVGVATLTGGASGDISTKVLLNDSAFYNDLYQGFISGGKLSFDLCMSSRSTGLTPDGFAFGIGSANDGGASFFDVFVQADLNQGQQTMSVFSPMDGVRVAVRTPDGASGLCFPLGLAGLGIFGWIKRLSEKKGMV